MISWKTGKGEVTIDKNMFFSFCQTNNRYVWQAQLPFRIIYEEVPCLRQKVLEDYQYQILDVVEHSDCLRLRLQIAKHFRIDLAIINRPDGFAVRLFPETLVEISPNMFRVLELEILPGLLQAELDDPGYFLLPNFCGSVVRFNIEHQAELRDMVYGDQQEYEHYVVMPVCGMNYPSGSWLCILTDGRFDARIVTRSEKKSAGFVYSLNPGFIIRHAKEDPVIRTEREVQFINFPEGADYNVMAVRYREYLLRERGMVPLADRLKDNPILDYAVNSFHCKLFHGMKFDRSYDGKEEMTVTTTFEEAETIARSMKADGVDKCVFFLTGWNPEGHDGKWPTRFPIEEKLGGEAGWMKLKETLDELDYRLSIHDNHVDSYKASEFFHDTDLLTGRSGEPVGGSQWGGGATYRVCPATMPSPKSLLDLERMKELGVNGIYYLDNTPSPIFTCHHPEHPAGRQDYAMGVRRLTQSARDLFGCVSTEGYQDYALDNVDMPWKVHAPFSKFSPYFERVPLLEEMVPFFQISYHGLRLYHTEYCYLYDQLEMNSDQAVALELSLGSLPMNEVQERQEWYIPEWRSCRNQMVTHFRKLCEEFVDRQLVFINSINIDRENNQIETVYADGIILKCDLNDGKIEKLIE